MDYGSRIVGEEQWTVLGLLRYGEGPRVLGGGLQPFDREKAMQDVVRVHNVLPHKVVVGW